MPIDDDTGPVAWRESGSGPLVLFLHGLGGSRLAWEPQLAALSDEYRCVAWDMPGYGVSAALEPLTFPGLADAVARVLEVVGAAAAHLVGLSLGGMIAMHTALRHPKRVRSLALLDTSPCFGVDGTDPEVWVAARLARLAGGRVPADFATEALLAVAGPALTPAALAGAAAAMARIPAASFAAAVRCLPSHDVRAAMRDITAPTLVVVGEHDRETPPAYAEALAAGIPGARLAVVAGAGHLSNLEQPDAVNTLLREWLGAQPRP